MSGAASPQDTVGRIKFADDLVIPVIDGSKTATVRYDGFEHVSVGDQLKATTRHGTPFARLEVRKTATANAVEAHDILRVLGAEYPSEKPQDVIASLKQHYDTAIRPSATVRVIIFEVVSS